MGVMEWLQPWYDEIAFAPKFQMYYVHLRFLQGSYDPYYFFHKEWKYNKWKYKIKLNWREITVSLSSIINFEFYLRGEQSLTCYVWRNTQIKHLGTCLCLILKNLQLIKYLKVIHFVKTFVLKNFHIKQAYCSLVLG